MKYQTQNRTSLKSIIDDILLLVRNNNISESEDLSRAQIEHWVNGYRRYLWKKQQDDVKTAAKKAGLSPEQMASVLADNEYFSIKETGPLKLKPVESKDEGYNLFTKVTETPLENIMDNSPDSILAVHDEEGENIQYMDHVRRHYHNYRKYTFGEMTAYYKDDGNIYVQGLQDQGNLEYIYVLALYENSYDEASEEGLPDNEDDIEDNILIPTWMVPQIKDLILKNELAFMLNRPSDDSNNATLASVKPHGPQDDEE